MGAPAQPQRLPACRAQHILTGRATTDQLDRMLWEIERRREGTAPFDLHDGVLGVPMGHEGRHFSVSERA